MPKLLVALVILGLFVAAGCGDDDDNDDGASTNGGRAETTVAEASGRNRADIEAAINEYFGGQTAAQICDTITAGYEAGLAGTEPSGDPMGPATGGCKKVIRRAVDDGGFSLEPVEPDVEEVVADGELAAARIVNEEVGPDPYAIFLVKSAGAWLVHGERTPPPEFTDLAAQVEG